MKIRDIHKQKHVKSVLNEVQVMKKIKHPNIIQLYDSFVDKQVESQTIIKLKQAHRVNYQRAAHHQQLFPDEDGSKSEEVNT